MANCKFCEMLSDIELESIIPKMIKLLLVATSQGTAINEEQIQSHLSFKGLYVPKERIRILISYIRINGFVPMLVYGSTGFYSSTDNSLVMDQVMALRFIATLMSVEASALEEQCNIVTH